MTADQINRAKVQRILDTPALLSALRKHLAENSVPIGDVLIEVLDDAQRDALRIALTD